MNYKVCNLCRKELPATTEYFNKSKNGKYNVNSRCKECHKEYMKKYNKKHYEENKEYYLKKGKKWAEENRDQMLQLQKDWHKENYKNNKEKERERSKKFFESNPNYRKQWHEKNKESNNAKSREWHVVNEERSKQVRKRYFLQHKDEIEEYKKGWRKVNKDKIRIYSQRNRQKRLTWMSKLPATFTCEEWYFCLSHFNHSCAYCGESDENLEQDHFIPLSKGGSYTMDNIVPACKSCNVSKHANDFHTWFYKQPTFSETRKTFILNYINMSKIKEVL